MTKELDLFGYEPPKDDVVSLQTKVERAIRLIKSASKIAAANGCPEIEVAFSGGKDSCVILELVKMSGVPYRAIYKNTTIDPAGNIRFCEDKGCEIIRPKESFLDLLGKNGYPNQFYRHCCSQLKEYKVLDYAIIGIRNSESRRRAERYKEPEQCREYSKTQKVKQYMPILDWSDEDVLQFVKAYNVRLHPLYYRKNGTIDIKKRLGCMGCPLAGNRKRIKNLKQTPKMVKLYIRGGKIISIRIQIANRTKCIATLMSGFAANFSVRMKKIFCKGLVATTYLTTR
jgi:phosphoadenosine phosphosulfate reductase